MMKRGTVNWFPLNHGIRSEILNNACVNFYPSLCSPHYFSEINISALALLKMVMHAKSGGRLEIMGLLLGNTSGKTHLFLLAYIFLYIKEETLQIM